MPTFKYKAKDAEGKVYEKSVEAASKFDIYRIIREEGGKFVSVREVKGLKLPALSGGSLFGGIKTHQKITFAKNLGLMMEAGLPVTRALSVMGRQSKSQVFRKLVNDLESDVSKGKTLSEALGARSDVFPPLFVSMVKAGEESGKVSGALKIIASQMEKSYLLAKKVRGAMIYPAVIISVMIVIAVLLLIFMVPMLTETFEGIGAELPLATRALIAASDFMIANTLLVISFFLAVVLFGIIFLRSKSGKELMDSLSLKIPVIGLMVKEFESARTARTLSSLLSAGVDIVVAIDSTIDVMQNHLYKDVLKKVRVAVEKGEPMSAVFIKHEHLYPVFVGEMAAVGEETGKISEMLTGAATYYEEEVDQKTKNLSTIIEPILMIIIGIGVGFFAISMLAPTYSLVDYIG